MRTWLKLIGSAKNPITEPPLNGYKDDQIGFRKADKPGIRTGDHLFLYAPGGSMRIFALAKAISNPQPISSPQPKKEGDCRWTLRVKYLIPLPVASGILINEISSDRLLIKSIQRASHIELRPKEYQSAYSKLVQKYIPECVDLPQAPNLPERVATTINRILRDSTLVAALKRRYDFRCQICGTRLELPNGYFYCEAHHIRPLGAPHEGLDEESNLVIVCPNHHVLLDYGAIQFSKDLLVASLHKINQANIDYHNTTIHKSPNIEAGRSG
jgi:predicted restriction endonuclease